MTLPVLHYLSNDVSYVSLHLPKVAAKGVKPVCLATFKQDLYEIGEYKFGSITYPESHVAFAVRKVVKRKYWFDLKTPWFSLGDHFYAISRWYDHLSSYERLLEYESMFSSLIKQKLP